jgi:hypothetical protein
MAASRRNARNGHGIRSPWAKLIGDIATEQTQDSEPHNRNPAAVALGKFGGAKGGKAPAQKLSKRKRSTIAQKAALARWGGKG